MIEDSGDEDEDDVNSQQMNSEEEEAELSLNAMTSAQKLVTMKLMA